MQEANATNATAASAWKKLSARTSVAFATKYLLSSEAVASSGGKLLVPRTSPNSSPQPNSTTVSAPLAAHSRCHVSTGCAAVGERPLASKSVIRPFQQARARIALPEAAGDQLCLVRGQRQNREYAVVGVTGGSHRFGVLGPLTVERDGKSIALSAGRQRTVLALLLLSDGSPLSRDRLIDELWGERPPPTAVSALHVHLSKLRQALGDVVESGASGYVLDPERYALDAREFDALVERARAEPGRASSLLRDALALYRGPPLADVVDEGSIAQWRRTLEEKRLQATQQRIDADLADGNVGAVIPELERLIADHPYEERLRAQQMRALARAGRRADALDAYQAARSLLARELGLEPSDALQRLQQAILEQDAEVLGGADARTAPGARVAGQRTSNLPRPPNKLVGREPELKGVRGLAADPDVRLITLTGPGGVGKTRLLVACAELLSSDYADGVVYVRLDPVSDPALVRAEIATTLGQRDGVEAIGADGLSRYLSGRELLLALDNFEQLLPAAVQIAELVSAAPRIRVLVTSRAALRIRGEQVFEVEPLALPAGEDDAALAQSPAVQLFLQCALAVNRKLQIDAPAMRAVGEICRLLDGLPLGLELAASRSASMTPAEIAKRLAKPLELGGPPLRDLPERQQTLAATIRWSYDLLEEEQRSLLRRASVFRGGFTEPALDAVLGRPSATNLGALVDASLVRRRADDGRFLVLDLVRAFALGELEAAGESPGAYDRHRAYFADFVSPANEAFDGGGSPGEIAATLMPDHANLRVALDGAIEEGETQRAFALALGLRPLWFTALLRQEAEDVVNRLLEQFDVPPSQEIQLLRAMTFVEGSTKYETGWTRRLATRAAELGDADARVIAVCNLAAIAFNRRDVDESRRLNTELVSLLNQGLGPGARGWVHYYLAVNAYVEGQFDASCEYADVCAEAAQSIEHAFMLASAVGTRLLAASARDRVIPQVALAEALDTMRRPSIEPLDVFALWLAARYAAPLAPETACRWLAHAERSVARLENKIWPENVLREEAMAVLGIDDFESLLASTPFLSHGAALEEAAAWVAERDPAEAAPRDAQPLAAPASR